MMDKEYEGVTLIVGFLLAGMVIGVMMAPQVYAYLDRVRDARRRWIEWDKEGEEIDEAVRGDV